VVDDRAEAHLIHCLVSGNNGVTINAKEEVSIQLEDCLVWSAGRRVFEFWRARRGSGARNLGEVPAKRDLFRRGACPARTYPGNAALPDPRIGREDASS
jgi:hypothetical protein